MVYQNRLLLTISIALIQCGGTPAQKPTAPIARSAPHPGPAVAPPNKGASTAPKRSSALSLRDARSHMVTLINRDRATLGLPPVVLDEGAGTLAAQEHANDMARLAYLGHWGSDGSVPEERHTRHGGADMILENALCYTDEAPRTLDPSATFDAAYLEKAEGLFFNEVPPNDGHRKNILKRYHTRVGIGIAQPVATPTELPVACIVQEFLDGYGAYAPIPKKAAVGSMLHVEGSLSKGAQVGGVGVARIVEPSPLTPSELNRRRAYPVPKPYQMYWPKGYVTPIPLRVAGDRFSIDIPLSDKGQPGLYEISVWAKVAGEDDFVPVGLRTMSVTAR